MNIGFLFDLDGVLIDSETEYTRIWSAIERCFPTGVENFARAIKGTTLDNILATYFKPEDRASVEHMLYDMEAAMRYDYCPGAENLLSELKWRGIPAAIVTSSKKVKMEHLRQQRPELWDSVHAVIDADSVTRSKPDPQGYLIGASRIGVDAGRCVVVEDSLQGIRAGKNAGSFVVGLTGTFGRKSLEGEPDMLIDSLRELDLNTVMKAVEERNGR